MLYKFIQILEVLMDQTQTKTINLKHHLAFIKINNLSDFQKSKRPITRMSRKSTRHYPCLENKLNKIYFQISRTPDSDWSWRNHFDRKSGKATIMKSLWKLTLALWLQDNLVGLATALNTHESYTTCLPIPTHLDHRSPIKIDINKTHLYTGKLGTANGYGHNLGYK